MNELQALELIVEKRGLSSLSNELHRIYDALREEATRSAPKVEKIIPRKTEKLTEDLESDVQP